MREIRGDAKNIRSLLSGAEFAIDYYQREYCWESKQVAKLIWSPDALLPEVEA
jgi:uncharacterized protein with ParB-like and HNH nuclease domain